MTNKKKVEVKGLWKEMLEASESGEKVTGNNINRRIILKELRK